VEVLTTAVEQLLDRFAAVVEAAPVAILVVGADGAIQVWSDGAERIFGWSDAEIRGRPYPEALAECPEAIEEFHRRLENGERLHGIETQHAHRNGAILDVKIRGAPIQAHDGGFDGGVYVVSDITEQKQREQRLAVLNRVLRHNIRNDVNVIQGHFDILTERDDLNGDHVRTIERRLSNIVELSRTARNIEQLREGEGDRSTINLSGTLRGRLERLRAESPGAHVSSEITESLSVVGHNLLPYAFDNILDNAIEHNDSTTPRVDISARADDADGYVVVAVADDGPGLPAAEREVLTSETETSLTHSSGLGLWLTRWIVRSSDGSIAVSESEFGGTCVSIRLRMG
jgi:PAS domain S-box-containing protein